MTDLVQALQGNKHTGLGFRIDKSKDRGSIYERVRWSWRVKVKRAENVDYILAIENRRCVGVFIAENWLASREPGKKEFEGCEAPRKIQDLYMGKPLPDDMKQRNAVMYLVEEGRLNS